MVSWKDAAEIIEFEKNICTADRHVELVSEIRDKMRRISDAKSSESGNQQDEQFSLV
jgi:hypothetical protein